MRARSIHAPSVTTAPEGLVSCDSTSRSLELLEIDMAVTSTGKDHAPPSSPWLHVGVPRYTPCAFPPLEKPLHAQERVFGGFSSSTSRRTRGSVTCGELCDD